MSAAGKIAKAELPGLPAPLVAREVDLRHYRFMPLDVARLRDSGLCASASPEEVVCALLLWCASWHQLPAGSLPDDDEQLAKLAGIGHSFDKKLQAQILKTWAALRVGALRHFVKCSDGRLYHPVVVEKAIEAWGMKFESIDKAENKESRQKRWRARVKEISATLRERGITPPFGASLKTLERLLETTTVDSSAPSTGDTKICETGVSVDASVDASADVSVDVSVDFFDKDKDKDKDKDRNKVPKIPNIDFFSHNCAKQVCTSESLRILFIEFWKGYPVLRHVHRGDAVKRFEAAVRSGVDARVIIAGAKRYADECAAEKTEKRFISLPAKWLADCCWQDEYPAPAAKPDGKHRAIKTIASRPEPEKQIPVDEAERVRAGLADFGRELAANIATRNSMELASRKPRKKPAESESHQALAIQSCAERPSPVGAKGSPMGRPRRP